MATFTEMFMNVHGSCNRLNKERKKKKKGPVILLCVMKQTRRFPTNSNPMREKNPARRLSDLFVSRNMKSFQINVVIMIIGNIPKHTVAPYTVAGTFFGGACLSSLMWSLYLYNEIHKCFEAKL